MDNDSRSGAVLRAQDGDKEAIAQLWSSIRFRLIVHINKILNDYSMSEDLCQTVFIKICSSIQHTRPGTLHFNSWVYTIAGNLARDLVRQNRSRLTSSLEERVYKYNAAHQLNVDTSDYVSIAQNNIPMFNQEHVNDPSVLYEAQEQHQSLNNTLEEIMSGLTNQEREVLTRKADGETYEEIGENMGLRWTQVKGILEKARSKARDRMRAQKDPPLA